MTNGNKIFSFLLSTLLLTLIGYLTFFVNSNYKKEVQGTIQVAGNNLLSENDYLIFARLESHMNSSLFPESVIKDRFEKHPYIQRADVEATGRNKINVTANEKDIKALIIINSEPYLISGNFQLLPLLPNINSIDVPVISNFKTNEKVKPLSYLKNDNMIQAFRIIDAVKALRNSEIMENLSEINLSSDIGLTYEDDIVLNFSGFKPAVIFGRGNEARKMICFETLWDNVRNGNILINTSDYVDLRYAKDIYFGNMNNTGTIQ